jgi:hypothetical protein
MVRSTALLAWLVVTPLHRRPADYKTYGSRAARAIRTNATGARGHEKVIALTAIAVWGLSTVPFHEASHASCLDDNRAQ